MSSSALLDISLTQLSKALPQTTSPRATFSIYLRWLDVHRREPTKCTEHWQNTLLHWTQSLRSRGFREYEIVAAVEDWKDANGPFQSQWRRYPPRPKEIAQAFDPEMERTRQMERVRTRERDLAVRLDRPLGDSYRNQGLSYGASDSPHRSRPEPNRAKKKGKYHPENYEGNPPPNYICNRCGKKGMWRARASPFSNLTLSSHSMLFSQFCISKAMFSPSQPPPAPVPIADPTSRSSPSGLSHQPGSILR